MATKQPTGDSDRRSHQGRRSTLRPSLRTELASENLRATLGPRTWRKHTARGLIHRTVTFLCCAHHSGCGSLCCHTGRPSPCLTHISYTATVDDTIAHHLPGPTTHTVHTDSLVVTRALIPRERGLRGGGGYRCCPRERKMPSTTASTTKYWTECMMTECMPFVYYTLDNKTERRAPCLCLVLCSRLHRSVIPGNRLYDTVQPAPRCVQ